MFDHLAITKVQLDDSGFWIVAAFVVLTLVTIFMAIREFCCWFVKASAITDELKQVNIQLEMLHRIAIEQQRERAKTNELLQRIADK
jgi:hypothetical protein